MLTEQTGAKVRTAVDDFASAAHNVAGLTADLGRTRAALDKLLTSLDRVVTDNEPELRRALEQARFSLGILAQHVDAIVQNLEGTTRNMNEFSRQIRQSPGLLLRSTQPADDPVPAVTGR